MNKKMFVLGLWCMVSMAQAMDHMNEGFAIREMIEVVEWTEGVSNDLANSCIAVCDDTTRRCDEVTGGNSRMVEIGGYLCLCAIDTGLQIATHSAL